MSLTIPAGSRLYAERLLALTAAVERLQNPYRAVATRTSTAAIATAAVTAISFTAEEVDEGGMFAPTSTTITLNTAGTWLLSGGLVYAANATGVRACLLMVNGGYQDGSTSIASIGSAADVCRMNATVVRQCAAGDQITLGAFQTSGGGLNVNSARLSVVRLA